MSFYFSNTAGTAGISNITISADSTVFDETVVEQHTISNENGYALLMPVVQRPHNPSGYYIRFKPTTFSFDSTGGRSSLVVESNDNWQIDFGSWVYPKNIFLGSGNTIIGISVDTNTGETKSYAISGFCLSDTAKTASALVEESGQYIKPYLMIEPHRTSVNASGYTGLTVSVETNQDWVVVSNSRWIGFSPSSGSGNGTITLDIEENTSSIPREGTITVQSIATGQPLAGVSYIVQSGTPKEDPYLYVEPYFKRMGTSGGTFVISVSSNTEWETSITYGEDARSWITLDTLNGEGDYEVNASIQQADTTGRTAYVSFFNNRYNLKNECNIEQRDIDGKKLYYTSNNGQVKNPYNTTGWGATILSNTYNDGQGIIEFDQDIEVIPSSAFYYVPIFDIEIPETVDTIKNDAFNNSSLKVIEIPDSVITIENNAYRGCTSVTGISFGNSIRTIGDYAFRAIHATGDLTIPNSVVSIGNSAFNSCSAFNGNLVIGNSVTSIGNKAFSGCSAFTGNLTIPNSVITLGEGAFMWCCGFNGNLVIGNGVTSIENETFYNCSGFTGNLTIGNSVTAIGDYAFRGCSGFTGDLVIPDSVTSIGTYAFYLCYGFNGSLVIGDSVDIIADYAFKSCTGFTSLTLGESVSSIGKESLSCYSLRSIYSYNPICPTIDASALNNVQRGGILHYPSGSDYSLFILPLGWTAIGDL